MTYLSIAHNRLLAGLAKAKPTEIGMWPTAQDFEAQAAHVKEVRGLLVEYLHSLATDGASNQISNSINSEVTGFVGDSMGDFASQFDEEAERLREHETEFSADRRGWAKAHTMGVD